MDVHDFDASLELGIKAERELDKYFSRWYRIEQPARDKDGIDRFFHGNNGSFTMQYKADFKTADTGNVFTEVVSVDVPMVPGWAFTGRNDWLCYWVPPWGEGVVVKMEKLKNQLGRWMKSYRIAGAKNGTYTTYGVCVPWDEMESLSDYNFTHDCPTELLYEYEQLKEGRAKRRPAEQPGQHTLFDGSEAS